MTPRQRVETLVHDFPDEIGCQGQGVLSAIETQITEALSQERLIGPQLKKAEQDVIDAACAFSTLAAGDSVNIADWKAVTVQIHGAVGRLKSAGRV